MLESLKLEIQNFKQLFVGKLCDLEKARDIWAIERFKITKEATYKRLVQSTYLHFWIILPQF